MVVKHLPKINYTIYYNQDYSPQEIQYPCDMFGLTGVVSILFNENSTVSSITYCKYNGQFYYDANTDQTIFFEDVKVIDTDVAKFTNNITATLGIVGMEKDEDGLSHYTSRSCKWVLSNALSIKAKWDTLTEDNSICYFILTFENTVNKE